MPCKGQYDWCLMVSWCPSAFFFEHIGSIYLSLLVSPFLTSFLNSELRHVHRQGAAAVDQLSRGAAALGQPPPQTHPEETPDAELFRT